MHVYVKNVFDVERQIGFLLVSLRSFVTMPPTIQIIEPEALFFLGGVISSMHRGVPVYSGIGSRDQLAGSWYFLYRSVVNSHVIVEISMPQLLL